MNAPDCICSPGRLPLGAFCAGRDDLEREALHDDRISIRAPRAGCDFLRLQDIARALISIHAPRVGRDNCICVDIRVSLHFNPRAPCGARRLAGHVGRPTLRFQSTRPVWGATVLRAYGCRHADHFNPRAPCGARPTPPRGRCRSSSISIHAPRVGRDRADGHHAQHESISIHAPRVGRDLVAKSHALR